MIARLLPILMALLFFNASSALAGDSQGKIIIVPLNSAFDSTVSATPVGGNNGTTIGKQRQEVFERAAFIWSNILDLHYDVTVEVTFAPLACSAGSATLGYAGPNRVKKISNIWYGTAQANQIQKTDTSGTYNDIYADFNSSIDNGCYNGAPSGWYYGLDNNEPSDKEGLLDVVLHEIGHGLGHLSFVDGDTGALFNSYIDAYSKNLFDTEKNKSWEAMTNAERLASSTNNTLKWSGALANALAATELTAGLLDGGIKMHAPSPYSSGSSISHISVAASPNQLMEPYNTDDGVHPSLEIKMFEDMGYDLKSELTGKNKPVASDYTLDIPVNGSVNLSVLANVNDDDTDDTIDLYTYSQLPANGSLSDNFSASAIYTPNTNFSGTETIKYQVYDSYMQLSNEGTITINVSNATAATANDDNETLSEDFGGYLIDVLANDAAGDNAIDASTLTIAAQPTNGSASVIAGKISYTPAANYFGSDSIIYHVKDTSGLQSNTATISLTVNAVDDAPVSSADNFNLVEDSSSNTLNLTANDSDVDSTLNNNQVVIVTQPEYGIVNVSGSGVSYTPDINYHGADSFTYKVSVDGNSSNVSTVSLSMSNTNDAPVSVADSFSIKGDATLLDILANDSDVDNSHSELSILIDSQPSHGALSVNGNQVSYTANNGYTGSDTFNYSLCDPSNASSDVVSVDLEITNAVLPLAVADSFVFDEDVANVPLGLTANDTFTGSVSQIHIAQQPKHGVISVNGSSVTFTANKDEFGQSQFSYRFTDETGLQSQLVMGSIMLINTNDAPKAEDDNQTVVVGLLNKLDILANDSDESKDDIRIQIVSAPANGTVSGGIGALYYETSLTSVTEDRFTYTLTDKDGLASGEASVELTMSDTLPVPVAEVDEFSVKVGNSKALSILDNDTTYTDSYSIQIVETVSAGSLIQNGNALTYTADGATGQANFSYTLTDEQGQESSAVNVVINKTLTTTLALQDDSFEIQTTAPVTLDVLNNDEYESINALTVNTDNTLGQVTVLDNHQISYQGNGTNDSFVYSITDSADNVQYAQVYINYESEESTSEDDVTGSNPQDAIPSQPAVSGPVNEVRPTSSRRSSGGGAFYFLLLLVMAVPVAMRRSMGGK